METITIRSVIQAQLEMVWAGYTQPEHIVHWNHASAGWHTPHAVNDLRPGGKFLYRMEAKADGSGFDFWGISDQVSTHQCIAYTLGDERKVKVTFSQLGTRTEISVQYEPEGSNPIEMQRRDWQAILDQFKTYVEAQQC